MAGLTYIPFLTPYVATKQALEALADGYRVELKPIGIHVSLIEPGSFTTPMADVLFAEMNDDKGIYTPHWKAFMQGFHKQSAAFPDPDWVGGQLERVLFAM